MIKYKTGNIFAVDVEALVNAVNCVGVMGHGIALEFKKAFPQNFKAYANACGRKEVQPGRLFVFDLRTPTPAREVSCAKLQQGQLFDSEADREGGLRYIVNFPTKRHWRDKSRIEDIDSGLEALSQEIKERNIRSIALPALGCGLGGLDWVVVRERIESRLRELNGVKIVVFEPGSPSDDGRANHSEKP